jgi:hypothetical protein
MSINRNLILVSGKSATGKSASLMNLKDPDGVMYLNCESGKELPFPSKFKEGIVINPSQVTKAIADAEKMPDIHTIVVDSLSFLMDMYESINVINSSNTMKAWGEYAQYFKKLMNKTVAESSKNIIFTAHTMDILNESDMVMETMVKVKGSTMNQGVEAHFCNVISTKKVTLKKIEGYENDLLVITPEEEALGFKYVFQTQLTKETVNERIRGPIGLWDRNHTYIDNDLQKVLDHLHAYYK